MSRCVCSCGVVCVREGGVEEGQNQHQTTCEARRRGREDTSLLCVPALLHA